MNDNDLNHLTPDDIADIHKEVLLASGGLSGNRPDISIDTVIYRVHFIMVYSNFVNIYEIGAFYAEAIAKGRVCNDGNKRTALVSMLALFSMNDEDIYLDINHLADKIVELASSQIDYRTLAYWIKQQQLK